MTLPLAQPTFAGTVSTRTAQTPQGRMLGQLMPTGTTPVSIYSPAEGVSTQVTKIVVANTTSSSVDFTIYHDEAGASFTPQTMLIPPTPIAANRSEPSAFGDVSIYMNTAAGNLGVQSSTANALNFTVYGLESQRRSR